ncbi:MAG: nucleoside-diphosphate sugar epimerase [Microbacteriaceae bacterium]|nr:nucleoside-diphosphate sugar epimerase [Microbacteriaceae bacterium]
MSGASGLIGTELVRQLREDGHDVQRLVRRQPQAADEHNWAPSAGMIDANLMDATDAVVNLSGASLGRIPWTSGYKKKILESRIKTTEALAEAMSRAARPPSVFLSASAVGIYGDRPADRLADGAQRGTGFLADVVDTWEQTAAIRPESTRLVNFRTGIVVGRGGALAALLRVTKLGLGSRFASGGQHWPWISLYDEAAAIRHLLTSSLRGPVNLAGPASATSDRLTAYLAKRLHRPYAFVLPETVVSAGMGEAGRELLLASQKVVPTKLLADGFEFRHESVEAAIDALIPR